MNIKSLDDYKNKEVSTGKKNTESYTGGAKSGMAVENNDLENIVKQAKEHSQMEGKPKNNQGDKVNCKITLYQNGFCIDDGLLREYSSEDNKAFMQELNKGEVPKELKEQYPQGMNVGLEDRRQEVKRPPTPPRYIQFSGQGVSMDTSNAVITQSVQAREYVLPESAKSTRV